MGNKTIRRNALLGMLAICLAAIALYAAWQNPFWQPASSLRAGDAVNIRKLADFGWDRVCVIPPYTILPGREKEMLEAHVRAELGISAWSVPSQYSDEDWLLVFVEDDEIVSVVKNENCRISQESGIRCIKNDGAFVGVRSVCNGAENRKQTK